MSTFGQRHSRVIVGTLAGDGKGMTLRTAALMGSDLSIQGGSGESAYRSLRRACSHNIFCSRWLRNPVRPTQRELKGLRMTVIDGKE